MVLRLEKLELLNFKTFQMSSFNFTPGHNVVLGENGAGKSSIFEAITYSLFGSVPGKTISSLIRHETIKMEIALEFTVDDKDFRVERSATKSISTALLMEKNGKRIAEKAKAVNEEIEQILGLGQRVFSNVVYIPQGQIAAIASERPSERRELFDKILGYYLYKKTSDRLRVIERSTDQSIGSIQERIRDFKDDIKKKEELETELENLELKLTSLQKKQIDLKPKLDKAIEKYEELNNEREEINQIEERLKSKGQEIEKREIESKDMVSSLEEILNKPLSSDIKDIKELKIENSNKLAHLEKSLRKLESKVETGKKVKNVLSVLAKQETSLEKRIVSVNSKMGKISLEIGDTSQNHLEVLNTFKSQKLQYEESKNSIKSKLEAIRTKEMEFSVLQEKKSQIVDEITTIKTKKKEVEKEISSIAPDWKTSLDTLLEESVSESKKKQENRLQELNTKKSEALAKITSLNDQTENESNLLQLIKSKNIETCPLCEQALDDSHRTKIKKLKDLRLREIKKEITNLTKEIPSIDRDIKKLQGDITELYDKEKDQISLELRAKELKQLKLDLKKQKRNLKKVDPSLKDLENIGDIHQDLESELTKVESDEGNIIDQIKRIENIILFNEQLEEIKSEMNSIRGQVKTNRKNFEYLELDENIKVLEQQRQDQKYILNIIPRLESLIRTINSIEYLVDERNSITLDLTAKKTEFDEITFQKYKNRVENLKAKKVQIDTQISSLIKEQIPDKKKLLREIKQKEKKLLAIINDLKITQSKLDTIGIVRDFTKEIVPILRRQHVMAISEYSTEIFSYLMNNEEYEGIEITEDYELLILQSGKKHDLTILSGGEQVIACLAIRLAIAKLLANQDIMLLDEPTVMLDSFRRKELVEVFDKTKPVRQTIIVTHDTEFERVADTTFTVVKRAGKATVIAEEIDHIVSQHKKYQVLTKERFKQLEIS